MIQKGVLIVKKIIWVFLFIFILTACEPSPTDGRRTNVPATETHRVVFEGNGGSGHQTAVFVEPNTALPEVLEPSRIGYRFLGWFLDEEATQPFDLSSPVEGPLTLYAGWEDFHFDLVIVNLGLTYRIPYNQPLAFDLEVPEFYSYGDIFWDAEFTELVDIDLMPSETVEVYVRFIPDRFQIEFRAFGTETFNVSQVPHGSTIQPPLTPIYEGFEFIGWAYEMVSDDLIDDFIMPTEPQVWYAQYRHIVYELTFVLPEGYDLPMRTYHFDQRDLSDVEAPLIEGYEFVGWYLESVLSNEVDLSNIPLGTMRVYARYESLADGEAYVYD